MPEQRAPAGMSREDIGYPPPVGVPIPPPPAPPEGGPGRVSPQTVLVGAGAVAVVAAGAASLTADGTGAGRLAVAVLATLATVVSVRAERRDLRTTEEVLAATAAVLAAAVAAGGTLPSPGSLTALAVAFLVAGRFGRAAVSWPLAAWGAAQLAVLTALPGLGLAPVPHVGALLGTALAGLAVALRGRPAVAVVALVTATPWWGAGVLAGQRLAWSADTTGLPRAAAAALLVVAAAGLVATRSRRILRPVLGPRPAVPVLAGLVAGAGVAGALSADGPVGVPLGGYLGLGLAAAVAALASPRRDAVVRPAGLSAASALTGLAVAQLLATGRWPALALLLVVAAVPALLVAARQPADRPGALPVTVGCLAGAVLLADVGEVLTPAQAGWALLGLAVATLAAAGLLRGHDPELPLAVTGSVIGGLALAVPADWSRVAAPLAVLGAALTGYGAVAHRRGARALGCAGLVASAWLAAATAGVSVVEAWSLPAAGGLLLYSGRRLADAPSWPAWGPALLTGFTPSVFLAVTGPGTGRLLVVVAAATLTTTTATSRGVQAPFVVGSGALVAVAVGRLLVALPWPALVAVAVAGALLVAVGALYESRRRQAAEVVGRVADMR